MWHFVSPKVVFGSDSITHLSKLTGESAFIVTDSNIMKLGLVEKVREQLSRAGIRSTVFDGVESDPSIETVRKGVSLISEYKPNWIVAVGGGSVIDAAKAIRVEYEKPDMTIEEVFAWTSNLGLGTKCQLICIPTTSGTGAEATWAIVLTDTAEQRKLSLGCRETLPDIAIVDPAFAAEMPSGLTAQTGMDVLTHAIEGFTSNWKNDISDGLCLKAIQLVFRYLPRSCQDGKDMEAREKMHNAACIAGIGFNNSTVALAHTFGHSLGTVFHVPHGRAVGLFLPYSIEFIGEAIEELWSEIAYFIRLEIPKGERAGSVLAEEIRRLAGSIKEPLSIKEIGIPSDSFDNSLKKLIDNAFADTALIMAARVPNAEQMKKFFSYAYEGKSIDF